MRFNKLILILLALFFCYGLLVNRTIKSYKDEINKLRWRMDNLETVVNHDVRFKLAPSPETKKEFSGYRL
jgi:hypothetical protein